MTTAPAHAADAFGTSTPPVQAANDLRDRLFALERQLEELKRGRSSAATAPTGGDMSLPGGVRELGRPGRPQATVVTGYEDLLSGGSDRNEVLRVEQAMTHEVLGSINGMKIVRDGENVFSMSEKDLKAYEVVRRKEIVRRLNIEAATAAQSPNGSAVSGASSAGMRALLQMPPVPTLSAISARAKSESLAPVPAAAPTQPPVKPAESKAPGVK